MGLGHPTRISLIAAALAFGTAVQARDFRSAEVHNKDFPTNKAVMFMSGGAGQGPAAAGTRSRSSPTARWGRRRTRSSR